MEEIKYCAFETKWSQQSHIRKLNFLFTAVKTTKKRNMKYFRWVIHAKFKSGFICLGLCAMGSRWLQLLLLPLAFQLHPCAQIRCSRLCITDKTCMVFMSAKSTCSAEASHESALKKKEEQGNGEGGWSEKDSARSDFTFVSQVIWSMEQE